MSWNWQEYGLRKKRILIIAIGALGLLGIAFLSAQPAVNLVRGWQARRHAAKAFAAIDAEKWAIAREEAVEGLSTAA